MTESVGSNDTSCVKNYVVSDAAFMINGCIGVDDTVFPNLGIIPDDGIGMYLCVVSNNYAFTDNSIRCNINVLTYLG